MPIACSVFIISIIAALVSVSIAVLEAVDKSEVACVDPARCEMGVVP